MRVIKTQGDSGNAGCSQTITNIAVVDSGDLELVRYVGVLGVLVCPKGHTTTRDVSSKDDWP